MKKKFVILAGMLLVYGCSGRPPAPVNKYGGNGSATSCNIPNNKPPLPGKANSTGNSSNRLPLPGQGGSTSSAKVKAEVGTLSSGKLTGQEVFRKCNTAVFMVFTSTGLQAFQGSGFFVSADGLAISNYHVFEGTGMGLEVIKTTDNREYKIDRVILKDKNNDVMVFTVKAPSVTRFNYIPITSRSLQIGDKVYAIGSPRGLENTFSSGEISQFRKKGSIIQTSAPFDHGSSGGALINEYGEVIGITSGGFDDSGANLNFAVNINVVRNKI